MQLSVDKEKWEIEQLLGENPYLHMYSIGDLDERFSPFTQWHGIKKSGKLAAAICIYTSTDAPTVMALCEGGDINMAELLELTIPLLPEYFQAHLSPGLERRFSASHNIELYAPHYKMALLDYAAADIVNTDDVDRLYAADIPMLVELYNTSYPENWFEPEMLELNRYFGIREDGRLIAAAGTHVYSQAYQAAAIGNITVRPEYRGRGFGAKVSAALCSSLLSEGMRVGLNVKTDNAAALACYLNIGFRIRAEFGEYIFRRK